MRPRRVAPTCTSSLTPFTLTYQRLRVALSHASDRSRVSSLAQLLQSARRGHRGQRDHCAHAHPRPAVGADERALRVAHRLRILAGARKQPTHSACSASRPTPRHRLRLNLRRCCVPLAAPISTHHCSSSYPSLCVPRCPLSHPRILLIIDRRIAPSRERRTFFSGSTPSSSSRVIACCALARSRTPCTSSTRASSRCVCPHAT
jgi:hypothetical protein